MKIYCRIEYIPTTRFYLDSELTSCFSEFIGDSADIKEAIRREKTKYMALKHEIIDVEDEVK